MEKTKMMITRANPNIAIIIVIIIMEIGKVKMLNKKKSLKTLMKQILKIMMLMMVIQKILEVKIKMMKVQIGIIIWIRIKKKECCPNKNNQLRMLKEVLLVSISQMSLIIQNQLKLIKIQMNGRNIKNVCKLRVYLCKKQKNHLIKKQKKYLLKKQKVVGRQKKQKFLKQMNLKLKNKHFRLKLNMSKFQKWRIHVYQD